MNPAELHNAKDEPAAPSLQTRLDSYIRQMAPHQRQREGGKLLIEAAERLKTIEFVANEAIAILENKKPFTPHGTKLILETIAYAVGGAK